jgi:hypothetical protein
VQQRGKTTDRVGDYRQCALDGAAHGLVFVPEDGVHDHRREEAERSESDSSQRRERPSIPIFGSS